MSLECLNSKPLSIPSLTITCCLYSLSAFSLFADETDCCGFIGFIYNSEHPSVDGFKCLFTVNGFSRLRLQYRYPPILLVGSWPYLNWTIGIIRFLLKYQTWFCAWWQVKEPKVYIHGDARNKEVLSRNGPGCSWYLGGKF